MKLALVHVASGVHNAICSACVGIIVIGGAKDKKMLGLRESRVFPDKGKMWIKLVCRVSNKGLICSCVL